MKILLIEDDLDDIELLQEALTRHGINYVMDTANDGSRAIDYIRHCEVCPDIVILDFNLPKIHGREVLTEIKSVASFKDIPLMILTTSSAKEDIEYSLKNGADRYLIKPVNLQQMEETVKAIVELADHK